MDFHIFYNLKEVKFSYKYKLLWNKEAEQSKLY